MTETLDSSDPVSEIRTLVTEIAQALVDDPAAVKVEVILEQDTAVLRLEVAPSDVGKVIGKQGRTARSLRTILGAASMKHRRRFALDIVEANDRPAGQDEE
ncbi:MAG TPA: KH domain-containing protein [Acidobacteriaceae bacterium]|nr:KH domain-containing protein [Acidobacteriaceae bacterium]